MARTKQTARKSEMGKARELFDVTPSTLPPPPPPPDLKRPLEDDYETRSPKKARIDDLPDDHEMRNPKKARIDDMPAPVRIRFVIIEAGEEHDTMYQNVVELDADGRGAFEAFMLESRALDETRQRPTTSDLLGMLAREDLDVDQDEMLTVRWAELVSKYHMTCTTSSSYRSYNQPWLHDVSGVFWISNWY
jgi:hypothetical protein